MVIVLTHTIASAYLYIRYPDSFGGGRVIIREKSGNSTQISTSSSGQNLGSTNIHSEEAYLPLLEARTIPELRLATRNALTSILSQLDHVIVYLKNPLSGIVEADGGKTLPSDGLLWRVYYQDDISVTECPPSLLDPLSDCLGLSEEDRHTHSVLCVPVPGKSDEGSIGIIVASFARGITTVDSNDTRFEYLRKQVSVCYQLIKCSTAIRRKSVCETDSHIESLIGLCGELYDQDAASLQIKVIKYLQQRTQAQSAFLLLVVPDSHELFCQVIGSKVLPEEFRFPGQSSSFGLALEKKNPISLEDLPEDKRSELYDIAGKNINSFLCVPIRRKGGEDLIALCCVVNKRGAEKFGEDDVQAIKKCFQYTATVLTSTVAFQNERKLKNQTQALLHVARKLFTRLGEYMYIFCTSQNDCPVATCGLYRMNIHSLRPSFLPLNAIKKFEEPFEDIQHVKNVCEKLQKNMKMEASTSKSSKCEYSTLKKKNKSKKFDKQIENAVHEKFTPKRVQKAELHLDTFGFMSPNWISQSSASFFNQGFVDDLPNDLDEDIRCNSSEGTIDENDSMTGSFVSAMYTPRMDDSSSEEFSTPMPTQSCKKQPNRSLTPNSMYFNPNDEIDDNSHLRSITPISMYYNAVTDDADEGNNGFRPRSLTPNSMYFNPDDDDYGTSQRSVTPNSMYYNVDEDIDGTPTSVTPNSVHYYADEDYPRTPRYGNPKYYEAWSEVDNLLSGKHSRSDTCLHVNPKLPDIVATHPSAQASFSEPFVHALPDSTSNPSSNESDLIFGFLESQALKFNTQNDSNHTIVFSGSQDHTIFVQDVDNQFYHKLILKDVPSVSKLHVNPNNELECMLKTFSPISNYLQKNQCSTTCVKALEENDLTKLLREIMQEARNLTQAERCSVFLIDEDELVAKVFDGISAVDTQSEQEIILPKTQGIAGHVATSGQLLNIKDAYSHPLFYRGIDDSTGFRTRNILCFPIKNEDEVVLGVAQLCNKKTGPCFTQFDEDIASAFAVYCCISISHCLMYRKTQDTHHRYRLANELMIFHMKVTDEEVTNLVEDIQPVYEIHPDFDKFSYAPRTLPEEETPRACMSMFEDLGFISKWRIKKDCLIRFTLMVKRGYRNPPYHNWMHAYSVAHFCYLMIKNLKLEEIFGDIEVFALFVSCLCHDIDHRGTTNSFQVESQSVLAALYSSEGSVMERHHFAQSMCILNTEGCNIFENLSSVHYTQVLDLMRDIILATDLAHHLRILKSLKEIANNGYDKNSRRDIKLLLCLSMTACDLSDQTKNWKNTKYIASLVYAEFFSQGDLEKALGQNPLEMMDRDRACIPDLQISFLDNIALPVYDILARVFIQLDEVLHNVQENRSRWEKIGQLLKLRRGNSSQQLSVEQIIALDSDSEEFEALKQSNAVNGR